MESWIAVSLGLMALCSIVQVAFLITLAVLGLRAARLAREMRERTEAELHQPMAHLSEAMRNVRDITGIVSAEARALRDTAQHAAADVREAKEEVRRVVRSPWVEANAFAKGVVRAMAVYREAQAVRTPATPPETAFDPRLVAPASWTRPNI
jgi:hypothetical protein